MRNFVIIQSADVQNGNSELDGRLDIGRVERAAFGGMLVPLHLYVHGPFDVRDRRLDIKDQAIGMSGCDIQATALRESDDRLIVFLRWPKSRGEFLGRQVMTVVRAGWIVNLVQQIG